MKYIAAKNISAILATALLTVMCGTQTKTAKSVPSAGRSTGVAGAVTELKEISDSMLTVFEKEHRGAVFYYVEGLKAANIHGDNARAAILFGLSVNSDSTFSPAYYAAATNIAALNPDFAMELSSKANALDSTNTWYRMQLGRLMVVNGRYAEAMPVYQSLITEPASEPENYRMLAALHEVSGKPFAAIAVLDSAETKFGKLEELARYKRELLIKVNLIDLAIIESQHLVDEYPYKYENYLILGNLYLTKRNDSLALANIEKASELNPAGIDPLVSLSEYYKAKGDNKNFLATSKKIFESEEMDLKAKIRFFGEITEDKKFYAANYFTLTDLISTLRVKYPENYEVAELYATNLLSGGNIEEAINVYKAYITDTTSILAPYMMIIEGETFLERPDSVSKYTELALARFPGNVELYINRAAGLQYLKREKEAQTAYRTALKFADTDSLRSVVLGFMGDTYHQQAKTGRTFRYYEDALKYNRDNVLVLNNYAYYLSEENRNLDKALVMAKRVMELEPKNPSYIDTYAWVLFRLGRHEEAKKAMLQAISLDTSGNPVYMLHYGDILFETGDYFMAKYYWKKALDAGHDGKEIEERIKKTDKK